MKKIVLALVGCGLALSHVSAEKESPEKGKAPGKRPDGSFFKNLDKDDDKAISKEEAGEHWAKMSQRDTDKDGKVTVQELMAGRPGGPGSPGGSGKGKGKGKGQPGEFFKRADKNSDGKISKDEVPAEIWERFGKLDKDEDGAVSKEEAAAGRPGSPGSPGAGRGAEMFARADKNKDGKLSKDEVPAEAWERLGRLDKNKDDAVTKEEMAAGMAMMRGAGKGKGGGSPGGPDAIFGRMDKDKDGKLSSEEVPAEMWSKLSKADEDADGLVSKAELEKVYKSRGEAGKKPDAPKKKRPELEKESA